jgi:hypothetical protein
MKLEPFNLERIQSEWEHLVDFNLSESGVEPLRIRELLDTDKLRTELLGLFPFVRQSLNTTLEQALTMFLSRTEALRLTTL